MSVLKIIFCLGICQISLFVRVLSDRFPVYRVTSCPRNDIEWRKASERLNCSLHYNKKLYRYHCLPDSKLTTLVEFCYDHIRPLVPKGNCVVLNTHSTLLDTYNCSTFIDGCPGVHFDSDTIFKYPGCLLIDTKMQCYFAENTCTTVSRLNLTTISTSTGSSSKREDKDIHNICLAAIIIAIFVVLLTPGVVWFIMRIKGKRRKLISEEVFPLTGDLEFEDTSSDKPKVLFGGEVCMRGTVVAKRKATAYNVKDIDLKWEFFSYKKEEWTKIKESGKRVTCCTTPPNPKLIIRRAIKEDEGTYKLTLTKKDLPDKVITFTLEVSGFPPEVNVIGGRHVIRGETASFVVLQSSYPEAFRIRWYKVKMECGTNKIIGTPIIDLGSEKYKGSTFDFLVINNVDHQDSGEYEVRVKNILGESTAKVCLVVKEPYEDARQITARQIENGTSRKDTADSYDADAKEKQTLLLKKEEKDLISISNVRRVYHISDAGSGNFWISDGGRLMNIDKNGYLIQFVDVGRFNTGCHCVTSKGELLYLKKEIVHVFNSSSPAEVLIDISKEEKEKKKKDEWVAWCIYSSAINNDILVGLHEVRSSEGKIQRYAEDGKKLVAFGESILCKPLYMSEKKNGEVVVSDAGKRSVVAVKGNKQIFEYKRKSQWEIFPTGLCTDESGCILVCIYENNEPNIHLLNESGKFLKRMLRKEDCAFGPCAICIVANHLYLGQESCQDIQVYAIKRDSLELASV